MSGRRSTIFAAAVLIVAVAVLAVVAVRSGQRRAHSAPRDSSSTVNDSGSEPRLGGSVPIRCEDAYGCKPGEHRTVKVGYDIESERPLPMQVVVISGDPAVIAAIDGKALVGKSVQITGDAGAAHLMTIQIATDAAPGSKVDLRVDDDKGANHGAFSTVTIAP